MLSTYLNESELKANKFKIQFLSYTSHLSGGSVAIRLLSIIFDSTDKEPSFVTIIVKSSIE